MSSWHSYPKIYNLGHAALKDIFKCLVLIEEKVDGSQFSFGVIDNELKCRSKGKELCIDAPEKLFTKAVENVKEIQHLLKHGYTYRGEYLTKPKHNSLAYDRIPNNNIIIFDINTDEETYLPYNLKKEEAERLGFETVPVLYYGQVNKIEDLNGLLDQVSILGGQKIEGFVVKNYSYFTPDGKAMMGKYVSEAFKEVHKVEWKVSNPGKNDVVKRLIDTYKTLTRWNKAIQHLTEQGKLTDSAKDIGNLIEEVRADIKSECADEIKDVLFNWAWPQIQRGITSGIPEWYKQKLMEKQFKKEE